MNTAQTLGLLGGEQLITRSEASSTCTQQEARSSSSTRSSTMQGQQSPPAFPKLPKSALFSKLEAFLPVMAEENKKLSEAVAAGEGAKHNIEVEEAEEQSDNDGDDDMNGDEDREKKEKDGKAPVIEMNFALGMMDENDSDDKNDDTVDAEDSIKAATTARAINSSSRSKKQPEESASFRMRLEKPSNKPRPVIQELN